MNFNGRTGFSEEIGRGAGNARVAAHGKKATERSLRYGRDDARQWRVVSCGWRASNFRACIGGGFDFGGLKPLTCLRGYVGAEAPTS